MCVSKYVIKILQGVLQGEGTLIQAVKQGFSTEGCCPQVCSTHLTESDQSSSSSSSLLLEQQKTIIAAEIKTYLRL